MFVGDVNIQPNRTSLPGIASLESTSGPLLTFVAAVAGIAIPAIAWVIGSHSGNPLVAARACLEVLARIWAALVLTAAVESRA